MGSGIKLGINGWRILGQRTGVGGYVLNVVSRWTSGFVGDLMDEITLYLPQSIDRAEIPIPENIKVRVVGPNARMLVWENLGLGPMTRDSVLWGPSYSRPLVSRSPCVVTTHDATQFIYPEMFSKSMPYTYNPLYKWSARNSILVITSNDASRNDIIRCMGVQKEHIHVVHLAAAEVFRRIPDADRDLETRRQYLGEPDP